MATGTDTPAADPPAAKPSRGQWFSRLKAFAGSADSGPAKLGMLGSVLITLGGLGAGSTRQHDPLLESIHMSWLRFGHGLVLSSIVLWTGVGLMLIAWLSLGRRVLAGEATEFVMKATTGFWLAPLLVSVPVFSRDTYSYLAQGALLRDGLDPYAVGPVANPNSLLDNVSPIWSITTAPYGPVFILVAKIITILVGNNVVAGTALLRLCMLPGLVLLIWATPRLARHLGADEPTALWICVLNPLVLIHLMGGVHNEMLMVGLMAAGIALTFGGRPVAGVTLITVAIAVKATAGIALPFLVWVWAGQLRDRRGYRPVPAFFAATAKISSEAAVAGVGLGWLTALAG
uniref:polyprenol phosphomannose-dependent alpha 1,6 mannosyltransferase MptB n=1 Tax=Mycobacterium avium TaxID=1764 RepID=UPI000A00283D